MHGYIGGGSLFGIRRVYARAAAVWESGRSGRRHAFRRHWPTRNRCGACRLGLASRTAGFRAITVGHVRKQEDAMARARATTILSLALALLALGSGAGAGGSSAATTATSFGPNVIVFDPSMPVERDPGRPPTRSTPRRSTTRWAPTASACSSSPAPTARPTQPLQIKVGYYTEVAGLGAVADRRRRSTARSRSTTAASATAARATASRSTTSGARCPT